MTEHRSTQVTAVLYALGLAVAGLLAGNVDAWARAPQPVRGGQASSVAPEWPTLREQLAAARVVPGSALERLIEKNQDFSLLRPEETHDSLPIPLWLRVLYKKNHPEVEARRGDPTGGYPFVLKEIYEWMVTHQDLVPGRPEPPRLSGRSASETGEERISGAQTSARSESDIRVNYWNTQKIIGASNNISASGMQAMFYSSNGGSTWGQTSLPLITGDSFHSDPTVDWTSDGTAWSTTIGINAAATNLQMRAYKSTNGGATWTYDATFSTGSNNDKQIIWVDHSATSPYADNLYAIWHNGNPAYINRRTGPSGSWQTPVKVSGSETTGTAIGDDVKTNSFGDVFGFFPDTGSRRLNVVKSTNGGVSFGTPVRIGTSYGSFEVAIPADNSRQALLYISGGAYRTSSKNNVYATWNDLSGASGCTSGGGPGSNASSTCKTRIWFARSTDGGATWSTPVKINDQSGLNDQFFPWMVVDENDGKVAITYYDTVGDSSRLSTNVYYQSSTDDGQTWSAPFKVTTASTNETTSGADSGNQYGDYTGLSGLAGTFFPSWTDRRNNAHEEIWTAAILDSTTVADFSISASPTSVSVVQGNNGTSTITTAASGSFSSSISLSASGQPSGVTVTFSPTSIGAPGSGSSTMTMAVGSSVTPGTYPITVTGTGGGKTHTTSVGLTVTSSGGGDTTPPTTSITAPADGATVSGTTSVTASASDNVGVTKVEFYIDSTLVATDTSSPYSYSWNTTTATNGSHSIYSKAYDAAANVGTSLTIHVTVSNATAQQLLGNVGFENGSSSPAPWVPTSGVIDSSSSEPAHSGSWKAWLDGYGSSHTDSLYQQVAIPSNVSTATLTFYLHIDTAETTSSTAYDTLKLQIRSSSGTVLATLHTYSNLDHNTGYALQTYNLSSYIGQTIRVYLLGVEDSSLQTSFVVDDFALNVQ